MNQDSHPRLKNLIFTETQAERIESKKTKANAEKVKQRRAIEESQSGKRDIRNPDDFDDMWQGLGYE